MSRTYPRPFPSSQSGVVSCQGVSVPGAANPYIPVGLKGDRGNQEAVSERCSQGKISLVPVLLAHGVTMDWHKGWRDDLPCLKNTGVTAVGDSYKPACTTYGDQSPSRRPPRGSSAGGTPQVNVQNEPHGGVGDFPQLDRSMEPYASSAKNAPSAHWAQVTHEDPTNRL